MDNKALAKENARQKTKNALKSVVPLIFLLIFEFAAGILLFVEPVAFTKVLIISFGAMLIVIGAIYLVRVIRDRSEGVSAITMTIALASLIAGILCVVFPSLVSDTNVFVILCGVIFIICGVYKTKTYTDAKNRGVKSGALFLVSALLSVGMGVVIIVNPFGQAAPFGADKITLLFLFIGASFIIESVLDVFSLLVAFAVFKKKPKAEVVPVDQPQTEEQQ